MMALNNYKGTVFEWFYATPTAIQVAAHLFEGFIAPSLLGIIFKYWREITRALWGKVVVLFPFNFDGLESIFDIYTLVILIVFAAIGAKLRKKSNINTDLQFEFNVAEPIKKRWISLRTTLIIFSFFFIFSISEYISFITNGKNSSIFIPLLFGYSISFAYIFIMVEFYLGFPYQRITEQIEKERISKNHSAIFVFAWPGLAIWSLWPALLSLYLFASLTPIPPDRVRELILELCALWFLLLWLSHLRLNWPTVESIIDYTKLSVNLVFLTGLIIGPLGIFAWNSLELSGEKTNTLIGGLLFLGGILSMMAFALVLKISWRIARNILLIVCFFFLVDRILLFVVSMIPNAS